MIGLCPAGPFPFPREYILEEKKQAAKKQAKQQKRRMRVENKKRILEERISRYCATLPDPEGKKTSIAFNTMFISGIKPHLTQERIEKHCKKFGQVIKTVVYPKRRYAFVEFSTEAELKNACSKGNSMNLDGEKVIVDVERARTVKDWKPKSLGGGVSFRERQRYRGDRNEKKPPDYRYSQEDYKRRDASRHGDKRDRGWELNDRGSDRLRDGGRSRRGGEEIKRRRY